MLSAKIYITDGKKDRFHSDFPITSELHGRLLVSSDSGLNYNDVDSSLWYIENDDFIFYNIDDIPVDGVYVKILISTNPDELYTVEVDSQLTNLDNLVNDSTTLANNVNQNVLNIKGINEDINNTYTVVQNIKNQVDQDLITTSNSLSISNTLVNTSNQNKTDLDNKITTINNEQTEAQTLVSDYQTLLDSYTTNVNLINNKITELDGYKTSIETNASLTTSAAQDAEDARDLAKQYRDESINVVNSADINITDIENKVTDAQQLEANASSYADTATTAAADATTAESNASGYVSPTETASQSAINAANNANSDRIDCESALTDAQNLATGNIINDTSSGSNTVYSSSKIESLIEDLPDRFIRDNLPDSTNTTYSAYKIENDFVNLEFNYLTTSLTPSIDDYLHIYDSNSGNYNKMSISELTTLFTNTNYEFNNLIELNAITENDYMYIYDGDTNDYKKVLANKVIDFSKTSTLYDFTNERYIGKDNNGNDIYRVSIDITQVDPLDNNFSTQQTLNTSLILSMDCLVTNTTTNDSESLKITATNNSTGVYTLITDLINTKEYNQILIYIDLVK